MSWCIERVIPIPIPINFLDILSKETCKKHHFTNIEAWIIMNFECMTQIYSAITNITCLVRVGDNCQELGYWYWWIWYVSYLLSVIVLRLLSNSTTRTYQHALVILDVDTSGVQGLGLEEWLANKIFCMILGSLLKITMAIAWIQEFWVGYKS